MKKKWASWPHKIKFCQVVKNASWYLKMHEKGKYYDNENERIKKWSDESCGAKSNGGETKLHPISYQSSNIIFTTHY